MHLQIIKWLKFFQGLLLSRFRIDKHGAIEVLTWLIIGHLFRLHNPNQLANALEIPKSRLYQHLDSLSLSQWKRMLFEIGCHQALEEIKRIEQMSPATQSRYRITLSVDDTVEDRYGRMLSYCYNWFSGRLKKTVQGQNIMAVTIKVGDHVFPLCVRLVPKQGRANTDKPSILKEMIQQIQAFFTTHGVDLTDYPITFDSWYGSQPLVEVLSEEGFSQILVHAKNSYVFEIEGRKAKLSDHKKTIELEADQWGCDRPCSRCRAQSPTFGNLILLFFIDGGKKRCMMVFGRPLRAAEILRIWHQHHGIEQFWRHLKSILGLKAMGLHQTHGAYAGVAVKVLAYLLLLSLKMETGLTFDKITLYFCGRIELFWELIAFSSGQSP